MVFMKENDNFHRILAECVLQVFISRYLNSDFKNTVVRKATYRYIFLEDFYDIKQTRKR